MSDAVAMSFKARMNKLSKECGLRPQSVIQNYMFERFLQRLAESPFRENFVIKGGVLISAMVGIRARSTMDVDTTLMLESRFKGWFPCDLKVLTTARRK